MNSPTGKEMRSVTHTHRFFMLTHSDYDISPSNIKILALDFPQVIANN